MVQRYVYTEDMTNTATAATKIMLMGPNLPGHTNTFHVHAAGCADLTRNPMYRRADGGPMDVTSIQDLVFETYPPEHFDYDEADWENYLDEFKVFPCVKLPLVD